MMHTFDIIFKNEHCLSHTFDGVILWYVSDYENQSEEDAAK